MALKRARRGVSEMVDEPEIQDGASAEKSGGAGKAIVTILLVIIILAGGWYLLDRYTGLDLPGGGSDAGVASSEWSAVFLSNGQVYFGKIKGLGDRDLTLTDIYYLQVVDQPLQRSQEGEIIENQEPKQELKMMKLGNELHGPTDRMMINRDHILLTETLKEDSTVVKSIREYVLSQEEVQE